MKLPDVPRNDEMEMPSKKPVEDASFPDVPRSEPGRIWENLRMYYYNITSEREIEYLHRSLNKTVYVSMAKKTFQISIYLHLSTHDNI